MRTIWKFDLPVNDYAGINMPRGAEVLHVHEQYGKACIWALVEPAAPLEMRSFRIFGTGHTVPEFPRRYIGTVHLAGGALVFHVFEEAAP